MNAVSGVLQLNRNNNNNNKRQPQQQTARSHRNEARGERGRFPQQQPISEQVAHSPPLYFNTANKEEEGKFNIWIIFLPHVSRNAMNPLSILWCVFELKCPGLNACLSIVSVSIRTGGAIITKNNVNPPVKIFPPGSGIAQRGSTFKASVPQPEGPHPKNLPFDATPYPDDGDYRRQPYRRYPSGQLVSVNVQPFDKRVGDVSNDAAFDLFL